MSTILFHEIVYGPVHSRRMGISLGINLLPNDGKLCSFDCIYCECGFNKDFKTNTRLPEREHIKTELEEKLQLLRKENIKLDVITFAGNGEPTLHPKFSEIIDDTLFLRNLYYPTVKISVLSNGVHLSKIKVFEALKKVDEAILKLDSAFDETVKIINRPNLPTYSVAKQVEHYKKFEGDFILQTMFIRGEFEGKQIDNTTKKEITAWLELVKEMNPREVMIYTIDRQTPAKKLKKVPLKDLKNIAEKVKQLGIKTNIAG